MDLSLAKLKEILTNNKLIGGRLKVASSDIQKIYHAKAKQNQNIQLELSKTMNIINSSLSQISYLKSELKYCEETLQKAFYPSTDNIALLYKNVGNNFYIKARFYWQGKQREVQVGSITIVLGIIQKMLDQGYLHDISIPKSSNMTWEKFKNKTQLIDATREIASLKFQEYIIRKLTRDYMHKTGKGNIKKNKIKKQKKNIQLEANIDDFQIEEKYNWYLQWRNNNLK